MSVREKIRKEIYDYMIQQMGFPQDPMETAKLAEIANEVINIVVGYMREDQEKNIKIVEKIVHTPVEMDVLDEKFSMLCDHYKLLCIDHFHQICRECAKEGCEHPKKVASNTIKVKHNAKLEE